MKRILIVTVVLILAIAGCGGKDDTSATESAQPALTAEEIIAEASPRLDNLDSFHFELSQEGGGTPIAMDLEMTGAVGNIVPPDRLAMDISAVWKQMYVETGLITVGEITYMQNPINGNWELLNDDFQAVTLFNPETGIKAVIESTTDPVLLEEQQVDGVLCFHLKGMLLSEVLDAIAVGHAAEGLLVNVEIWIGVEDFLLRKVVFDGQICEDENPGIVRTLTLSDFNEPITIELPE